MAKDTKKGKLTQILSKLTSAADVLGAAVITKDGLLIASELSESTNGEAIAATAAAMQGAAETAVTELEDASPERIIIESKKTKLITIEAGEQAILACIVNAKANLGLILMQMDKGVLELKKEIK